MQIDNCVPAHVFPDVELVAYTNGRSLVISINQCGVCRTRLMVAIEGDEAEAIRARVIHELSEVMTVEAA